MEDSEMKDDSGMVMEVEGAWNLSRIEMLSFMQAVIRTSVYVLVF